MIVIPILAAPAARHAIPASAAMLGWLVVLLLARLGAGQCSPAKARYPVSLPRVGAVPAQLGELQVTTSECFTGFVAPQMLEITLWFTVDRLRAGTEPD